MGFSTLKSVVPFKIEGLFTGETRHQAVPALLQRFFNYCEPTEEEDDEDEDFVEASEANPVIINNWQMVSESHRYKNLYVNKLVLNEHTVYLINESMYSNAEDWDLSVFSDSKDALEKFSADFEIHQPIEENKATVQTL